MGRLRSRADISLAQSRQGNEVARSMTNTSDFPLMSVSALHRHTSSRSSLTETARSALLYESKCIFKNNLTANPKVGRTLKQHVQRVPFIANYSQDNLKGFACADIRDRE